MEKNIWEKALNTSNQSESVSSLMDRESKYPLTLFHLRNYLNTHEVDDIQLHTLYQYFGEHIYDDWDGYFLPHLACVVDCISPEKKLKALEVSFQVFDPNIGSLNHTNMNYFQLACLNWRREWGRSSYLSYHVDISAFLLEMYDLGICSGMQVDYRDIYGNTNLHYLLCCLPLYGVYHICNKIVKKDNYFANGIGQYPHDYWEYREIGDPGKDAFKYREDIMERKCSIYKLATESFSLDVFLPTYGAIYEEEKEKHQNVLKYCLDVYQSKYGK